MTNVRFNYLYSPLSDIFLVYTERRDLAAGRTVERVLAAKVSKSHRILSDRPGIAEQGRAAREKSCVGFRI